MHTNRRASKSSMLVGSCDMSLLSIPWGAITCGDIRGCDGHFTSFQHTSEIRALSAADVDMELPSKCYTRMSARSSSRLMKSHRWQCIALLGSSFLLFGYTCLRRCGVW